ncbi:helix-turn-helix domain-containing protein [Paenibacillus sp. CN-4]|uniref:helix-turn-helix domain-containing protein n=1 Tax=Paenibacillus nanchangensis TaxID=3348343 RepID=UPI00397BBDD3
MKALIVDDESRVRKAVRLLVDWSAHGIEEILEAESGSEAIEIIRQAKPALVIMDMMMDYGSGVELMSWVSEFADTVKFIVVSGHNDFDFVRHTVRHGGIDYLLKPIEADAINNAVAKAVAAWQTEEEERRSRQRQNIRLNEFKPVYGEKLLSALIDDSGTAEGALRRLRDEGVLPAEVRRVRLLLLQTDTGDGALLKRFGGDNELMHYAIVNICNEFMLEGRKGIAFRYWGAPSEVAILLWENMDRVGELVNSLNQGLFRTLQLRLHFGASIEGGLPGSLPEQYAQASAALMRRNLLAPDEYCHLASPGGTAAGGSASWAGGGPAAGGSSGWTQGGSGGRASGDAAGGSGRSASAGGASAGGAWGVASGGSSSGSGAEPPLIFPQVQEAWRLAAESRRGELIAEAARHWIEEWTRRGRVTPEMLAGWKSSALLFRSQLLRETLGEEVGDALTVLERADALHPAPPVHAPFSQFAWSDWAEGLLSRLSRELAERQHAEGNPMAEIVKYIQQHYQSEISLQEVAGRFFVSREYISRKFKQEFGINFSDYIANYRIDKSKQLMLNPHLKLSQVAEMVGFHDVKYFSKVFKKKEGLTPKEYRDKLEA